MSEKPQLLIIDEPHGTVASSDLQRLGQHLINKGVGGGCTLPGRFHMEKPKLSELSPEQVNAMIAEVCGATEIRSYIDSSSAYWPLEAKQMLNRLGLACSPSDERPGKMLTGIPDYINDLNAMAAAEATLFEDQHFTFRQHLEALVNAGRKRPMQFVMDDRGYVSAPSIDRAHAFLLTHGLATR